jgi:hypothetical protein
VLSAVVMQYTCVKAVFVPFNAALCGFLDRQIRMPGFLVFNYCSPWYHHDKFIGSRRQILLVFCSLWAMLQFKSLYGSAFTSYKETDKNCQVATEPVVRLHYQCQSILFVYGPILHRFGTTLPEQNIF